MVFLEVVMSQNHYVLEEPILAGLEIQLPEEGDSKSCGFSLSLLCMDHVQSFGHILTSNSHGGFEKLAFGYTIFVEFNS